MTRLRPSNPQNRTNNTLFILTGGPGQSGWSFISIAALLFPDNYGITYILPDHRGTGLSSPLACDDNGSQNVTAACIPYLISRWTIQGLNQFSITAAAHDIAVQIQYYQSISPGRISIYGISYGTMWLDRILQIFPNLVQSAIMDSVINPLLFSLSQYDLWASSIATRFFTYCQFQIECNKYFPAYEPPHIMLVRLIYELDENKQTCVNNYLSKYQLTAAKLRIVFFNMIGSSDRYFDSTVTPAIIFRLNRCNEEDVTSELWLPVNHNEVNGTVLSIWYNSIIIGKGDALKYILLRSQWPKYPLDQYRNKVASYSPLLMLSGQLDTAAPLDFAFQLLSITGKTRTLYTFPIVGHAINGLATSSLDCPIQLIFS